MSELVHFLRSVCLPAKVYLALIMVNFFTMLLVKTDKRDLMVLILAFIFMLLFGLAIVWFGNYLCLQGFEIVTWIIVLIPLIGLLNNLRKIFKSSKK